MNQLEKGENFRAFHEQGKRWKMNLHKPDVDEKKG
jgi:hypothetical protein